MGPLARRSFELHARLAEHGDWGYRRMDAYSGQVRTGQGGALDRPRWLSDEVRLQGQLGGHDTTAQVDPGRFTRAMMEGAEGRGARLRIGTVDGVSRDGDRIDGVLVDGQTVRADAVVLAMGPWSVLACQWLPVPAIHGLKGHSAIFGTDELPATALFLEAGSDTPELFPRPDGTVYVCGASSETPLPVDPAEVRPDRGAMVGLRTLAGRIAPALADAPVRVEQACYRPITADALPLIGAVPGLEGAYLATGHNCWGILNAPATGEAMAGLLLDGASRHVDLSPFDPARLPALDGARIGMARAAG